jgi:hypothetical protein
MNRRSYTLNMPDVKVIFKNEDTIAIPGTRMRVPCGPVWLQNERGENRPLSIYPGNGAIAWYSLNDAKMLAIRRKLTFEEV